MKNSGRNNTALVDRPSFFELTNKKHFSTVPLKLFSVRHPPPPADNPSGHERQQTHQRGRGGRIRNHRIHVRRHHAAGR